eukprot:GEMP01109807.1.p1 GENE.GEMP01109807.1~~GEMP01109807.1.p1  ORF type:complete len:157 (+),score=15.98 GEMP01109807.1:122-592(+)
MSRPRPTRRARPIFPTYRSRPTRPTPSGPSDLSDPVVPCDTSKPPDGPPELTDPTKSTNPSDHSIPPAPQGQPPRPAQADPTRSSRLAKPIPSIRPTCPTPPRCCRPEKRYKMCDLKPPHFATALYLAKTQNKKVRYFGTKILKHKKQSVSRILHL